MHELAGQRLAAGHVGVGLHPHAADRHEPPARRRAPADAREQLGLVLAHPRVLLGRRRREHQLVVGLHQLQRVGERAGDLADGLAHRPQPRRVDVRVARRRTRGGRWRAPGRASTSASSARPAAAVPATSSGSTASTARSSARSTSARRGRSPGSASTSPLDVQMSCEQPPHRAVQQSASVDRAEVVERVVARGGEVAERGRRPAPAAGHVGVGRRLDVEVDRAPARRAGTARRRRLDAAEDRPVGRVHRALGLEAGPRAGEPEVDDQLRVRRHSRGHRTGDVEPRRAPRPSPRLADGERAVLLPARLGERHRLARRRPRRDPSGRRSRGAARAPAARERNGPPAPAPGPSRRAPRTSWLGAILRARGTPARVHTPRCTNHRSRAPKARGPGPHESGGSYTRASGLARNRATRGGAAGGAGPRCWSTRS